MKKHLFKFLKISSICITSALFLLFLIPKLFPDYIVNEVKLFANQKIKGELTFKDPNLSFFEHFPSLTLTLTDFSINGAVPFKGIPLIDSKEISFGINLSKLLFYNEISINKIYVKDALLNLKVNTKGEANYNVYESNSSSNTNQKSETSIKLDRIDLKNIKLIYDDQLTKLQLKADGFNYLGKGNLDKAVFELFTDASINSFDFAFNGQQYLKNKSLNATLITKINTNYLSFEFKENDLLINKLPVDFKGVFNFVKGGYYMDFKVKSINSNLNDFFTALPPQFTPWLKKTKITGKTDFLLSLKGQFIENENLKPDLNLIMKIRKGGLLHDHVAMPVTNLFLNFDTQVPALDPKKMTVKIDSVFFNIGADYFNGIVKLQGLKNPVIDSRFKVQMDLEKMNKAFGFAKTEIKGVLNANIQAKGIYDIKNKLIPKTTGFVSYTNGYLKTELYPNPITDININLDINNKSGKTNDLQVKMKPASFVFEGDKVNLVGDFENLENIKYDFKVKGQLDLGKIYQVFSKKGLDVKGFINANLVFKGQQSDATSGNYSRLKSSGTLVLRDITTQSQFLPKPFIINEGFFSFFNDQVTFKKFKASYGKSDFLMSGTMSNLINFVLADKAVLNGDFTIKSDKFYVDEFRYASPDPSSIEGDAVNPSPATGVVIIPPNFNIKLKALASNVYWQGLKLTDLAGDLTVNKGMITLKESGFSIIGSPVVMDVVYKNETLERAFFDFKIKADTFDIKRAYNEIEMFRKMASAAKTAQGQVSLDYAIKGKLNKEMKPIFPSLSGGGILSVKDVQMKGFKMFNSVSKSTNFESIKDPNLTKVDIKTTIKNNIIAIEQFKFKFAGFRPRIEGTTSFDGQLNLKMRLGLPPLGIIGIPLTITGTQEKPKVKLGRKSEEIEEKEYTEP